MALFPFQHYPLRGKTVLVRVDFNVPLEKGKVVDNYRIKATLPTLNYLLQQNCKLILATHLGQPEGKVVPELRTNPLAQELQHLLPRTKIIKVDDCIGSEITGQLRNLKPTQILFLENLRFYRQEEENNPVFAHALASLADIYVNDAFGAAHRKHASIDAITHFLPSLPGLLMEKEIHYLSRALNPVHPSIWIMGGAKLDKVKLVKQALEKAEYLLLGGALCFSFLKAQGINVGMSKVDQDSVQKAREILQRREAKKLILPVDLIVANTFSSTAKIKIVPFDHIQPHEIALDLGPDTIKLFQHYLRKAQTIIWNGPLGYYEWAKFATATKEIGRFLGKLTATSIAGGGETAEALRKFHLDHLLTHVSTGGGAAVEFLSGRKLPGIAALELNYKRFHSSVKQ